MGSVVRRPVFAPLILRIVLVKARGGNDCGIPGLKGETWGAWLSLSERCLLERCLSSVASRTWPIET
jgi:hypothetical protein